MIIVCGGIKGGAGKTTTATNLAIMRSLEGKDVLLIDGDSVDNANASDFSAVRDEETKNKGYTAIQLNGKAIATDTPNLAKKYDDVIIDVGGHDSISQRASLVIADIYLLPVFPSSLDVWTLENVITLINEVKTINTKLKALCFLSRADVVGNQNQETREILEEYKEIELLDTIIKNRKAYRNATSQGLAVVELKPKDKKAIEEIKGLYDEIF